MTIREGSLVSFKHLKNARGYPLTGTVVDEDGTYAIVNAYGLYGPGSETNINDVPLKDLEDESETPSITKVPKPTSQPARPLSKPARPASKPVQPAGKPAKSISKPAKPTTHSSKPAKKGKNR